MDSMLPLIKSLLNNTIYTKYSVYVKDLTKDNKELTLLLKYLDNLHNKYERDISITEFSLYVLTNCMEKDKPTLSELLKRIASTDSDSLVLDDILSNVMSKQKAYELAIAALEVSEGRKDFSDLLVLAENLNATESVSDSFTGMFVSNDLRELYNETKSTQGLRWRLNTLNKMLGSLRKGDFGFIFARPESGKTTFLASEVTHFATQVAAGKLGTTGPIIWFNNEEQGSKVYLRLYQAMLGLTLPELISDFDGNKNRYMELGGNSLRVFDSASIHRKQVEQVVRELQPSLVIFDQLDKIKGFTDDREDLRLGSIYIWAREIAKQYCPVIAVCQADASGEGKKWLTMENVANAKTAKQAEADWILGIGKTHNAVEEYTRHLHLCKNKLTGDKDTDPDLRHGRQSVVIDPSVARYKDM